MTEHEGTKKPLPFEIHILPADQEHGLQLGRTKDGMYRLAGTAHVEIIFERPATLTAESFLTAANPESGTEILQQELPPLTEPHSASEKASTTDSPTPPEQTTDDENQKFKLVGNPANNPSYRERKSGKKIADFVLATHPDPDSTQYWRVRTFDKQAEKVRDQVRKGQTGVEVTVYGPKQWKTRKKTKDGEWKESEVSGYYAGFVKVPKLYREEPKGKPHGNNETEK